MLRTFGLTVDRAAFVPPQGPGWSHLAWARSGAMSVRTDDRLWFATGDVAVWIPAGVAFGIAARGRTDLRIAYVADRVAPERELGTVVASGIVREIAERSITCGYLDPRDERDHRLSSVFADELARLEPAPNPLALPFPRDGALRRAVDVALDASGTVERPDMRDLAGIAGMSIRTFERRFVRETALTPRVWLRRARLREATCALVSGASISEAALGAGYASLSAFVAAYRSVVGVTPGRFIAR